ncbi:hypothetical protein [Nocardia nepalensis]|uniref:hypothetical protein n=1 Tax=Nocardia nepalensis TaxID=3375448 RepID=UPI003B676B98
MTQTLAYSGFLDLPAPLHGSATVFWIFTAATIVMVVASVVIATLETYRMRSVLPLVVLLSATLWLPNEPFIDTILGFQYAADSPAIIFTVAGRVIPLSALGIGAMFFLFPWFIYRMTIAGVTMRKIVGICLVAGIIDWVLEWMAIHWKVFEYYGDNPSRILGLPFTSMVQNCFVYSLMAAAILFAAPHLKGWKAVLFIPVIPGCYFGGAALCTWPAYLALHAEFPAPVFLPLALIAAAMNVYIPLALLKIADDYNGWVTGRAAAQ